MKLPIQARPIMRSVSSVRISHSLMSGVTSSECNMTNCGVYMGVCGISALGGPVPFSACMVALGGITCRDCISNLITGPYDTCQGVRGQYGQCIGDDITAGAYKLDGPAIYYSNGKGGYCQYDTVENFLRLNHGDRYRTLPGRSTAVLGYRNDGVCR